MPTPSRSWPVLGDALAFRRDPLDTLRTAAARGGDVALLRLGPVRVWLLGRPDLVLEVLTERPHEFVKSRFLARRGRSLFGRALTAVDGDAWTERRRVLQDALGAGFFQDAAGVARRLAERAARRTTTGEAHDLRTLAGELCMQLALACLVGDEDADAARRLARAASLGVDAFGAQARALVALPEGLPCGAGATLRRAMAAVRDHLRVSLGRKDGPGRDLASRLLRAGMAPADPALLDDLAMDVAVGAHQSALLLAWSLVEASRAPGVLHGAPPEPATVRALVAETLRLHPPFYLLLRQTTRRERFDGTEIARGDHVAISPWLLQRDARYHARPEAFDPRRFARGRPVPGTYLPYGLGPRGCPGRQLASTIVTSLWSAFSERHVLAVDASGVRERASAALELDGAATLRLMARPSFTRARPTLRTTAP